MPQPFRIKTDAFPASDLQLESFSCSDGLGVLTEISASLLSPRSDLDIAAILGKPVTFEMEMRNGALRHLHGFVSRFAQTGATSRFHRYQAIVRPWLWFLTRTTDCRIFQDQTVPEIVKTVFADHPIAVHDFKTFRDYRKREYCVQYRESDFVFVSRLLEHEGIYYRFEHEDGKHTLVLLDSSTAHDPQPEGADSLRFVAFGAELPDVDVISRWASTQSVQPGKFAIKDFDFQIPGSDLFIEGEQLRANDLSDAEWFDYPGGFITTADGTQYLENRRDEVQSRFEVFSGTTNALALRSGFTLELNGHPRPEQNAEYLVTSCELQASNGSQDAGTDGGASFNCEFRALLAGQQFRPARITPKPVMTGPQTAVIVGKEGEEIHTDKFGRVRVQFHWDRRGKKNEKSSCLVRVAQIWAGRNFGAMFIPRVGHEVIVDFLEGDPDQPIVTGSVYNGDNMPPWTLPAHATQSGVLTRSTKGGAVANANMIQFEDKKGSEALNLHAERNMSVSVEADQSSNVGHDRSTSVKNHDSLTVSHGRTVTIEADGEVHSVTGGRRDTVTGDEFAHVTGLLQNNIDGDYKEFTGGLRQCWNAGSYTFSSSRAFLNAGPEYFLQAFDVKTKATGNMFIESAGAINAKASVFKFAASGDINFTGVNFNRTIFQGNDTILGPNTNTYIGASRNTAMGSATTVYMGMSNACATGVAISSFLGVQISNAVAISIANAAMAMSNQGMALGITGLNLTQSAMKLDNDGLHLLNGGGGAGGAGGGLGAGAGTAAEVASAVAGAFSLGFGGAAGVDARMQAQKDIDDLMANNNLTPAVKARLQAVVDSHNATFRTPEAYGMPSAADQAAQTAALGADTPGATPSVDPSAPPGGAGHP